MFQYFEPDIICSFFFRDQESTWNLNYVDWREDIGRGYLGVRMVGEKVRKVKLT